MSQEINERKLAILLLKHLKVCKKDNIRIISKGSCKSLIKTIYELSKEIGFSIRKDNSDRIDKYICIIGEVSPSLDSPAERYSINKNVCKKIYKEPSGKFITVFYPTEKLAKMAEISLIDLKNLFYSSLELKNIEEAEKLEAILSSKNIVRITGEKTDISFSIQGKKANMGQINIPEGEVFIAPIKYTVEGKIYFDAPIKELGIFNIYFSFSKGKVNNYFCDGKSKVLEKIINRDSGSCYIGEFGIGFNENISPIGLSVIDEKSYGTIHLALGQAYGNEPSINNSAIHVDFVKTKPTVFVDGKKILDRGNLAL